MRTFQVDTTKKQFQAYFEMLEFLLSKGAYDDTGLKIGREEAQQTYHKLMSYTEVFKENDRSTIELNRSDMLILMEGLGILQGEVIFPKSLAGLQDKDEIISLIVDLYDELDEYWDGYYLYVDE